MVHIYTATALERGRVARPTHGRFYPGENPYPWYSFYRRLGEFQDQSGHEELKKNLHPSEPGVEPSPSSLRTLAPCYMRTLAPTFKNSDDQLGIYP